LHNSLFLIAHFHNTIIGGVVFGYLAGFNYWFPKAFGFKLNEKLGKYAFWCWLVGFYTAFMPLYVLGFMGMTRRLNHYDAATGWHPFLLVAALGAAIIACGIAFQVAQLLVSIKERDKNLDTTGDPWNGRTLEWATTSPPPFYNFAKLPVVEDRDAFWDFKQKALHQAEEKTITKPHYEDIHMPRNTGMGFIIGGFSFVFGFAVIWQILWLTILSAVGMLVCVIVRSFDYDIDYYVKADEVEKTEILSRKK
jgi:cytochrome o ubiquinol oxidase subunit 1